MGQKAPARAPAEEAVAAGVVTAEAAGGPRRKKRGHERYVPSPREGSPPPHAALGGVSQGEGSQGSRPPLRDGASRRRSASQAAPAPTAAPSAPPPVSGSTAPFCGRVGFSGIKEPERLARYKKVVETLGGTVVESAEDLVPGAALVVEPNPLRTVKLCAGVSACELVTPSWLEASAEAGAFEPLEPHALHGEQQSKGVHWDASAARAARVACAGCLAGHTFVVTKQTTPRPDELETIIRKAGGKTIERLPTGALEEPLILVWNDADRRSCHHLLVATGVFAVKDTELLDCVLRQAFHPIFA